MIVIVIVIVVIGGGCYSTLLAGAWTFHGIDLSGVRLWDTGGGIGWRAPWRCRSGGWGLVLVRSLLLFGLCRENRGVFRPI